MQDSRPRPGSSRYTGALTRDALLSRLATHKPQVVARQDSMRQAAVAIILRPESATRSEAEILFIRRAEKTGDPWSGQMAFPGGHREKEDPSLQQAAMRETLEEIGLDLAKEGHYIGALDQEHAVGRGRPMNLLIAPHVFQLTSEPKFEPNYEVAEVVWTPLKPILSGDVHTREERVVNGSAIVFDGYRINGGHFVWGLTYRMVHSLCRVIDDYWTHP